MKSTDLITAGERVKFATAPIGDSVAMLNCPLPGGRRIDMAR